MHKFRWEQAPLQGHIPLQPIGGTITPNKYGPNPKAFNEEIDQIGNE